MPVYEARCDRCGKVQDYYANVAECYDTPSCCGTRTRKVILTSPFGIVDIPAYQSPVTGKWINSRSERKEDLKRTNSRPWEGIEQEAKVAQERAKDEEKKQDAKLQEAAVSAWQQLPTEQRQALEAGI